MAFRSSYSSLVVEKTPQGLRYYRKPERTEGRSAFAGIYGHIREKEQKRLNNPRHFVFTY